MDVWLSLLTPLAALALLWLFRFAGCSSFSAGDPEPTFDIPYPQEVKNDSATGYWRLHETTGTTAKNEVTGSPDGVYAKAANPLPEGDVKHHSPAANPIILQLGVTGPPPLLTPEPTATSIRVQGGFVKVPFAGQLNPPQFTLEALVLPEWNLNAPGKYYCVMESSSPTPGQPTTKKRFGYALYCGPQDPTVANSPYHWQFWVGNGTDFVRLAEKPYAVTTPVNPGPVPLGVPTYLAVTYDGTKAFLFVYVKDRDFTHVKYELTVATPYKAAANVELFIGATDTRRALFSPFPGPTRAMYPFIGRIQEVAIYAAALHENRIGSHAHTAIEGI